MLNTPAVIHFTTPRPTDIVGGFLWILEFLGHAIALNKRAIEPGLLAALVARLNRLRPYFLRQIERYEAGTLPKHRSVTTPGQRKRPAGATNRSPFPPGLNWLNRWIAPNGAVAGDALRGMLRDDDAFKKFLAAAPGVVRELRWFCRMLGVEPSFLPKRSARSGPAPAPEPAPEAAPEPEQAPAAAVASEAASAPRPRPVRRTTAQTPRSNPPALTAEFSKA